MQLRAVAAGLPCARLCFSRRLGRRLPRRPAVDCTGACAGCPWSGAEQARRLAAGRWVEDEAGLLCLHFPPAEGQEMGDAPREGEQERESEH